MASLNAQKQQLNVKANNLHVQLWYNLLNRGYQGQLAMEPLYVASGKSTPVNFRVSVPVVLQRDRIDIHDGSIVTPLSKIQINGSVENLRNPKTAAHINGHIALADLKNVGDLPLTLGVRNVPDALDLDANATVADNEIRITGLRLGLGHSNIEASGTLKDPKGNGSLQFKTQLALGEIGRLAGVAARPDGVLILNGDAKLDAKNNYDVTGNLEARNVSVQQGAQKGAAKIGGINLVSAIHVDPHHIDANGLRLNAFGGEFAGDASLADFERYKVNGSLRNLDIQTAARTFGVKSLPYDGIVSGPLEAQGDTKAAGTRSIVAKAHLSISPGRHGIPLTGKLNADYSGAADNVIVSDSYIALPHTRLNVNGSLNRQLNISLTSRDLNDLLAAAELKGPPPVVLNGGQANFTGSVTGALKEPRINGHLAMDRFAVEGRAFNALAADVLAASSTAAIRNGSLTRASLTAGSSNPMQALFSGSIGLHNWSPVPRSPVVADVSIRNGDLADVMVLAGQPPEGYAGALTADAHVSGTYANPQGTATLQAANGQADGEPFNSINARVNFADQLVTLPAASVVTPAGHIDLTADFQHPRDSFSTGRVHAHLQSGNIDLAKLQTLQKQEPKTGGTANVNADVTANISAQPGNEIAVVNVNADASAKGLRFEGENYGDFNATARTNGQTVAYNVTSDFAGSNIKVNGSTQLAKGYPTTADASLSNLPIERLLVLAKQNDIPAKGKLSGTAHVNGSLDNPQGSVDLDLVNALVYDEPLDHVRAKITYLQQSIDVPQFEIVEGPSRIDLTGRFDHPANNFDSGNLQFKVNSNAIDLTKIHNIHSLRPDLGGILQIAANGTATVKAPTKNPKDERLLFTDLNADVGATGIRAQGKNLGDLTLKANTNAGRLNFALDSNLAGSAIQGRGNAQLSGDYPVDARITFNNVAYSRLQPLLGTVSNEPAAFEATTEGVVTVRGPALDTNRLNGSLQLSKLQLATLPQPGRGKSVSIQNQGPIALTLNQGVVHVDSAHLTGPETDIQASGTAALQTMALNLTLNANANLAVLQNFDRDLYSSGKVVLATTVRGTASKPLINGQLDLQNATMNYAGVPNGISNANGRVVFNGNNATIQNITAETGGGKVTLAGFVGFADTLRFGVRASGSNVRVRVEQGVSVTASTALRLTGTLQGSVISGDVTIDKVSYAPQSDIGSLLSRTAPPVQTPTTPSPLLDNMKLDIRVRTSPALAVQAALAQNLQLDADLRVRGTASEPAVLGRLNVTEGQLVFFGSTYTVNSGSISFYNPVRIEPILNISLETQAKGVDVILNVTGPIDNMKLTYTSDPPLQFQEIVQLLASGKTPTSDPTLLANQPSDPQQSFQQMGESAIVGKALADPVSNRLQRVFGVTQLKIDPAFTSGSQLPTAQLTLQQQVSSNVTFTYTSALSDPNSTIVRVEWAFNPQFSAVASRDQNGIFSLIFFYKKQLR